MVPSGENEFSTIKVINWTSDIELSGTHESINWFSSKVSWRVDYDNYYVKKDLLRN